MKKKQIIVYVVSIAILGVCAISAIIIFKPQIKDLQDGNVFNGIGLQPVQEVTEVTLSGFVPELENVVKNGSGEIVNISLKKSPRYLPSDSLFINGSDAVSLSDITVGDTLYLSKLGPKFNSLLENDTIDLEVCRTSDCSRKLILKIPRKPGESNLAKQESQEEDLPSLPLLASGTPFVEEKGYTLIGRADYRKNDDLEMPQGNIDGNYTGSLDKKLGFSPKVSPLFYKNLDLWGKYPEMAYEMEVSGKGLNTRKDMYLLNFDGDFKGIKYNFFDKDNKRSRIHVNNKIHTINNTFFSEKKDYILLLETNEDEYIISLYEKNGEKIWTGVGVQKLEIGEKLFIGSRNLYDTFAGEIKYFSIYYKR